MTYLTFTQTLFSDALPNLSQLARIEIDPSSGDLLIHDPVSQSLARASLSPSLLAARDFAVHDQSSAAHEIKFDFQGGSRRLDRATLQRLAEEPGETSAYLDGSIFYGGLANLASASVSGKTYLYLSREAGSGLDVYALSKEGALTSLQSLGDTSGSHLRDVSAMTTVDHGGSAFLIAASSQENGLSLYNIGPDGRLTHGTAFGFDQQLPLTTPTAMTSLTIDTRSFVLVTAHGTSSLSVLEIADGALEFRDQVNDGLNTRFAGAAVVKTFVKGNLALVAVAGNDGGVTLMQLLPGGRLLHRETVVDSTATALDGVTGLQFAEHAIGTVDLFVASSGDAGLSRFQLDTDALGITATGRDGTSGNDVLSAAATGGQIQGLDGDDVMLDGGGGDTLLGGAGADVFVFLPDGREDRIGDFNPREDKLDLSGFARVHDISSLGYRMTSNGAVVTAQGENLSIVTHNGQSLSYGELAASLLLAADHVLIPKPLAQMGGSGNDRFDATRFADTIDGGSGFDTVNYGSTEGAVIVNLSNSSLNGGGAAGDVLISIEGLIGSNHSDRLIGSGGANNIAGGSGNDTISGGDGADWITPGPGSNVVDGGDGRDMLSFVDLPDTPGRSNIDYRLTIDMTIGRAVSHDGSEVTSLNGIERITGTIFADWIKGDAGDNELRGLGDYDWFVATSGSDTIDGGTGQDMLSFVEHQSSTINQIAGIFSTNGLPPNGAQASGLVVDLANPANNTGLAAGLSLKSIERITGSGRQDVFYGDAGQNDFRGLGDYDWFVSSEGGRERYFGGDGSDTVTYFNASSGIVANLSNGAKVNGRETGYGSGGVAARDLYFEIENLVGSRFDDELRGSSDRNQINGLEGDDFIFGYGGVDYLKGGIGNDVINGGSGSDYALFDGNAADYVLARASNNVTVTGPDGTDQLIDVEYFRFHDTTLDIWSL